MAANQRSKGTTPDKTGGKHSAKGTSKTGYDAIAFLSNQHREVEALFRQFEKLGDDGSPEDKESVVRTACEKLTVHAQIEEEIFYPAAQQAEGVESLLKEAEVEHGSVKQLIATLEQMNADDEMFDANFTVLAEYVKHHVKEEEGELFSKLKKSDLDLEELGQELADRADELIAETA